MVLSKNGKPDAERKSAEREHAREQVRRQQSLTPTRHDGGQSAATSTNHPNETDDYGPLTKALATTDTLPCTAESFKEQHISLFAACCAVTRQGASHAYGQFAV